ncbi:MAG: PorT family protein [Chitinophagales bacterium]|nr:PorT family protein [Chitinophagales bacterium]MCB9022009.1 PorT family protein [Chitinophagales bacterium]MCB9031738.1 PorT family protein [Chitinophagales bacterium]HPE96586.1 porin family protein [Chitinophagales bacterium]HPR29684.1 porin family protein [Chitinophagales bacterium]
MKKIALLSCLFIFLAGSVKAQDFRFGLTAAPLISWFNVDGTDVENDGTRLGFQYGLLFEPTIGSVERYAISTGVIVNMLGGFLTAEDTTLGNINTTLRVQYIEIPATIKLRTNEINYFTYYGMFGLNLGMNIKARYDVTDGSGNYLPDGNGGELQDVNLNDKNSIDQYKFFNLALSMGIGTEYSITETTTLTAGLVFQNGFVNVFETAATDEMIQMKQMVLRMGVLF